MESKAPLLTELEHLMLRATVQTFRDRMSGVLQGIDDQLALSRDRSRYKICDMCVRELETALGTVRFERRRYWDCQAEREVYLLDEHVGLEKHRRIGPGLEGLLFSLAAEGTSYRGIGEQLTALVGEPVLSHEGIRQAVCRAGDLLQEHQSTEQPRRRVRMLVVEADGWWTSRQRKKGSKRRSPKRESRQVIIHEGWQLRSGSTTEYELVNKKTFLMSGPPRKLWSQVRLWLESRYESIDETLVVISGDGASWIRAGTEYFGRAIYQYDRFHVARTIRRATRHDSRVSARARAALRDNDRGQLMACLESCLESATEQQRRHVEEAIMLVQTQWQYIVDYRIRLAKLRYETEGLRGLGAIESNVSKIKQRVRGKSWSGRGLDALLNVVLAASEGRLGRYLNLLTGTRLPAAEALVSSARDEVVSRALSRAQSQRSGCLPALEGALTGTGRSLRAIAHGGLLA